MNKVKNQSSRKWLLIYLIGFSFLNLVMLYLFTQFTKSHVEEHLHEMERIDYKISLQSKIQNTLGMGHYLYFYREWLDGVNAMPDSPILQKMQQDFYEINRLLDLYENVSGITIVEKETLFQLRQKLKLVHNKIPLIRLSLKQGVPLQELRQMSKFHPEDFVSLLESLKKSIDSEKADFQKQMDKNLLSEMAESAFITIMAILLMSLIAYGLVFRRALIMPMKPLNVTRRAWIALLGFLKLMRRDVIPTPMSFIAIFVV